MRPSVPSVAKWGLLRPCFTSGQKVCAETGVADIRRLKQHEEENAKLKQLVADLMLNKTTVQDALRSKVVKPIHPREVARHYQDAIALLESKACQAMGFGLASRRYQSRCNPAEELRMRLKELAESRVRYGCRRLHILLQRGAWQVNHKRLYRL